MKKTILKYWPAAALVIMVVAWLAFVCGYRSGRKTMTVEVSYVPATVEEFARVQPLALQANLLVVAGANKAGADAELGAILFRYAEAKQKQLIEGEQGKMGKREWVGQ